MSGERTSARAGRFAERLDAYETAEDRFLQASGAAVLAKADPLEA
jgi:hypothetical protein